MARPVVLIVAGLDPSGGAGLVADVATVARRGLHPAAVATALTVQDSARCHAMVPVDAALVRRQLAALLADLDVTGVKIGMVGSAEVAGAVDDAIASISPPIVLDPVLRASVGADLLAADDPVAAIAPLLARATLVTPNREEAARLTGRTVDGDEDRLAAARALIARGARAVLVKGGHFDGAEVADLLVDGDGDPLRLRSPRVPGPAPHGTGCALSTEIACALAAGASLREAVATGHSRVAARIAASQQVGTGRPFLGP